MAHARLLALGLTIWLGASLTAPSGALAQSAPRLGGGASMGGSPGAPSAPPRPPRLTLPSDPNRPGDGRFRPFYPYYWPFGYYYDSEYHDSDYYDDTHPADSTGEKYSEGYTETQRVPVQAPRDVYPVYDTVTAVEGLTVSSMPMGSKTMVRLSWRDGVGAKQVAFFLADSARNVLTAVTLRAPPFTALFQPPAGAAYAGMTVLLPGGTLETQYVPLTISRAHPPT
ncbi:MAG TPA: hypothetical protein VIM84_13900 [Gemmatimonadales bacterium]